MRGRWTSAVPGDETQALNPALDGGRDPGAHCLGRELRVRGGMVPARRPLTYDEVQALFDAADGLVAAIQERRRKGARAAVRL